MLRSYTRGDHTDDFQQDLLVLVESSCSDPTLEDIIQTISIRPPRFGEELCAPILHSRSSFEITIFDHDLEEIT